MIQSFFVYIQDLLNVKVNREKMREVIETIERETNKVDRIHRKKTLEVLIKLDTAQKMAIAFKKTL